MKLLKSLFIFTLALLCFGAAAQVPMKFNYQAVARNANGTAMASQNISVRILLTNGPAGASQYTEHHQVTTNPFGVFSLQVGSGMVDAGNMNDVSWSGGNVWIKVELDANGGSSYTTMGFAQLLSVPYAMVAGSSLSGGSGSGVQTLNDLTDVTTLNPTNGQVLSFNGTQWIPTTISLTNTDNQTLTLFGNTLSISGGNSISLPTNSQTLSLNGNVLSISGGNSVTIPSTGGGSYSGGTGISVTGSTITNTGDLSATNELQTLSLTGNNLSIANGNSITLPIGTDAQTLTLSGNTLSIANGNSVTLPSSGSTYTAGSGINITGSTISATDNSIANEIQTLSLSGNTLSLSQGGSVTLPSGSGAQALNDLSDVNTSGVLSGHVLKYDGTNWTPAPDNTSSGSTANLWQASGNNIYKFNSGNVGVGTTNPQALFHVRNATSTDTTNAFSVENNGDGYNFYSYKSGSSEAVYLVKDNAGSGTPNIYATNNGSGNTMDVFATGSGYAGNFRGGQTSPGGLYAKTTSSGYAGVFDGDVSGGAVKATVAGAGLAGLFQGKVKVEYDSYGGTSPQLTLHESTNGEYARLNFQNTSGASYWTIGGAPSATNANAKLSFFYSQTSELMTLTGDGNVGIVNTAPTARLHVVGGSSYVSNVVKIENTNGTSVSPTVSITTSGSGELINASKNGVGYGINIQKTGSLSSSAAIYGGNAGSNGEGVRGSVFGAGGYGIYGNAAGNGSASFTGVYGYGSGSTGVDYGIYGQQGASTNDYAGYFAGNVGYTGTLLSTSDARLKNNIQEFKGGLNAVMQLDAKTYEYKHDGAFAKMNLPQGQQIGLIAQDLEKVLPELIEDTQFNAIEKKDGEAQPDGSSVAYKGVNYIGMIPVLVNAIQEQQAQIEELKKQIEELKK